MRTAFLLALPAAALLVACQPKKAESPPPPAETPVASAPAVPTPEEVTLAGPGARELAANIEGAESTTKAPPGECDPKNKGAVSLTTLGVAGDSFRITLKCGDTVVAQCVATIPAAPAGQTMAHCSDGPKAEPAGPVSCTLGRGMRNSVNAVANPYGCAY